MSSWPRPLTWHWLTFRCSLVIRRWHYYLLDFCYFANALMLAHLWLLPHSALLHKARVRDRRHIAVLLER